jgi:hypothetical protein
VGRRSCSINTRFIADEIGGPGPNPDASARDGAASRANASSNREVADDN